MTWTVLRAADRPAQAWRNGGGLTYEIARGSTPGQPDRFSWRVSIACVEREGPFSAFAGYERLIAVIEGQGMELHGVTHTPTVLRPFEVVAFSGSASVSSRLASGPVKDFNVIFDPARCRAGLRFIATHHEGSVREAIVVNLAAQPMQWRFCGQRGELARYDAVHTAAAQMTVLAIDAVSAAVVTIEAA